MKFLMLFTLILGVLGQTNEGKCYLKNRTTTTTTTTTTVRPTPTTSPVPAAPIAPPPAPAPAQPITASKLNTRAFRTPQSGIGSWFRANHKSDDTNGNSWCGYPYKDYTPGFAPDLSQMSQRTNAVWPHPRWEEFGKEYCGLEAIVRNPETGVEMVMYIVDAFDPKWVRSPGSIDIMLDVYKKLTKSQTVDKNRVIKNVEWRLTGNRNPKYAFKGPGDR